MVAVGCSCSECGSLTLLNKLKGWRMPFCRFAEAAEMGTPEGPARGHQAGRAGARRRRPDGPVPRQLREGRYQLVCQQIVSASEKTRVI